MTSRGSRGATNKMFGFNKINNTRKRNSTILDNSVDIGSVGNSISNENNALLASQAAMAVLYQKSTTSAATGITKKRYKQPPKNTIPTRIKTTSRNEKLPITKITVSSETHRYNVKPQPKIQRRRKENLDQKQPHTNSNSKLNIPKLEQNHLEVSPLSYESLKAEGSKKFSAEATPNSVNPKDSAKTFKKANANASLETPRQVKSVVGHGLSRNSNENGSSGASLSAMAATKALTEFQKAEIVFENDNETMFHQKYLEQESKNDSFHLVNQPRKLTIDEEIQEQIYNDDLLKNLVKDKAEALKINSLTNNIAMDVLKNYEYGASDNSETNGKFNKDDKQANLNDRKFVEVEKNEVSEKSPANDSKIKFNVLQVKRRPPPLNETDSISDSILPRIDTYFGDEKEEPIIQHGNSDRESKLSDAAYSDISSLLPIPIKHKNTFRSISDPVSNQNLKSIEKTRSRAITVSDKSTPATSPDNKSPTTRTRRSHTISTLFKDILSSSNSTATSGNISPLSSSVKGSSSAGNNKDSNDHNRSSPNLLKRTIRSLSLSINNSTTDKPDTIVHTPHESQQVANTIPVEEKVYSGNARPEYSVLKNKKLPSYYQSRNDLNTHGNGNDSSIQFRSTLRGEVFPSKRSKLKSYIGLGHSGASESHKHSLFGKRMSLSKDSNDKKVNTTNDNESIKSSSEYTNNNSSALSHYDSYSSADDTNISDDTMSNFETPTDIIEEKPHNNNHKADLFLKIPAKLAYKSMKKHTDNWEFNKNKTFKKVLIQEERRLGLRDDDASFVAHDTTPSSIMDSTQQSIQSESPYILGLHSRSKRSNKFDENKPWKSHIDLGYITSEEKKRYEGIWVSNKNRFLDMLPQNNTMKVVHVSPKISPNNQSAFSMEEETTTSSTSVAIPIPSSVALGAKAPIRTTAGQFPESEDLMVNFVVYEIFNRSNLPPRLLAQIYSLIDLRHDATITKKSFIVGMWLIDQCLYGKKLPAAIPDLVWDSVDKMVIGVDVSHKSLQRNKKRNARREIKELKRHEKFVKETIKKEQQQLEQLRDESH